MAAMFAESALVHSGLLGGMLVIFNSAQIFTFPPQLWRLLSPFLLTGGGFSFVWDLYFSKSSVLFHEGALTCFSVHIFFRLGAQLTSVYPAWRLLHLCVLRGDCHFGMYHNLFPDFLLPLPFCHLHTSHICPPSLNSS